MHSRPTDFNGFKADVAAPIDSSGHPVAILSADLGIPLPELNRWGEART